MRHPEPAIVTHYRNCLKAEPPRLCHLCDHYTEDGVCEKFNEAPPKEFADTPGACAFYEEAVPF